MSNMHVLTQANGLYRIVAHIAIPVGNNSAGVAWRAAIVRSGVGGRTVLPDGDGTGGTIDTAVEKPNIVNGSVYEDVLDVDVTRRGQLATTVQLAAFLDEWYAARSNEVLAMLQKQLTWYGQTR